MLRYCPNGPTFAEPRNWSDTVLSKGANSAGIRQGSGGGTYLTKEDNGSETPGWVFAHRPDRENKFVAEGRLNWMARFKPFGMFCKSIGVFC